MRALSNLPVNPLAKISFAQEFFRRHRLVLGLLLLVAFKLWLVRAEEIYGSATEFDALWFLNSAKHWYWGSEYSWTAFVRPPAYPLFVGLLHLCEIPLRTGIELMQITGYLALIAGFRKAGVPRLVCLASFAAMVLHPGSFQLNNHTMADTYYAALLPLVLGGLLLTLLTAKPIHAMWTGLALARALEYAGRKCPHSSVDCRVSCRRVHSAEVNELVRGNRRCAIG